MHQVRPECKVVVLIDRSKQHLSTGGQGSIVSYSAQGMLVVLIDRSKQHLSTGGQGSIVSYSSQGILVVLIDRSKQHHSTGGQGSIVSYHIFQHFAWHCTKARVCLLTRIMHVDLRLKVGNFGVQQEFLNLRLNIFVPFQCPCRIHHTSDRPLVDV